MRSAFPLRFLDFDCFVGFFEEAKTSNPFPHPMKRRDAIERIALILGGAISAELSAGLRGEVLYIGASVGVTADQQRLLAEAAEVIIPATETPGAKAAGVEQFITRVLSDCYRMEEQVRFYEGLAKLDADARAQHGRSFIELDLPTKNQVMRRAGTSNKPFFALLKQLTVAGYFTSEIGATKALSYLPIPGRFQGEVPLQKGQRAWAL
jgi:hypothetical protein